MKYLLLSGILCLSFTSLLLAKDSGFAFNCEGIELLSTITKDSTISPVKTSTKNTEADLIALTPLKVQVKLTIHVDRDQVKRLNFGYQDEISVFINEEHIYLNNRGYSSRHLSIEAGKELFDHLFIPLKKGANELILEGFQTPGGIGIRGVWEEVRGEE